MSQTCETCRFMRHDTRPGYGRAGHCRRLPPTITVWTMTRGGDPAQPGFEQNWPWMQPDDWCGEYAEALK